MEGHMKELMSTIEHKNKTITEKDDLRQKLELNYQKKLAEAGDKITQITLEKEHLRHKIIRLNLNAKGEGENSIENMLKRLTRVYLAD
jgi:adenylate kinase